MQELIFDVFGVPSLGGSFVIFTRLDERSKDLILLRPGEDARMRFTRRLNSKFTSAGPNNSAVPGMVSPRRLCLFRKLKKR